MDPQQTFAAATQFHRQGDLAQAEALYRQILAAVPDAFPALQMLGVLRGQQGRHEEAVALMDRALAANPGAVGVWANRGNVLATMARFDAALVSYDKAIALRPDFPFGWSGRGSVLRDMGRPDEALDAYARALALKPDHGAALEQRAGVLWEMGRLAEALADYDAALALEPNAADSWSNRGFVLQEMMRLDEALVSYDRAIAADPNYARAHWNKALCHLLRGEFAQGWAGYGWHLALPLERREYPQPRWSGAEDFSGKTLFLYTSQGLGDAIQFYRFAVQARARGAQVILSVQDALIALLRGAGDDVELIGAGAMPPPFDYHAALMDLPMAFGVDFSALPGARIPYLFADPARVAAWAARIGSGGFRIGIAWTGKKRDFMGGRSFALSQFEGLSKIPGVRLIALQKEPFDPPGFPVERLEGLDAGPNAFLDTAAAMMAVDLVVTADTSIAHLAGALGRPAFVALRHVPDWRWFLVRDDSPWYPSLRLFRQAASGDWAGVFARIEAEVTRLCRSAAR